MEQFGSWAVVLATGATALVTTGCAPVRLTVDDAVVMAERQIRFAAFVEREPMIGAHDGLKGVTVRFLVSGREVAAARTDGDGRARALATLPNKKPERFIAQAIVRGRPIEVSGDIYWWEDDKVTIAVDVDGTVAYTDYDELFLKPEDYSSRPVEGAARALSRLAKDFNLFYLTARPRYVLDRTRRWLARNGFPPGPVLTAHRMRDMIAQARYKRHTLLELREQWPNLAIGIGNTNMDAEVYGACHMLTLIVDGSDEARYRPHALVFPTWDAVAHFFAANGETLTVPENVHNVLSNGHMLLEPIPRWRKAD